MKNTLEFFQDELEKQDTELKKLKWEQNPKLKDFITSQPFDKKKEAERHLKLLEQAFPGVKGASVAEDLLRGNRFWLVVPKEYIEVAPAVKPLNRMLASNPKKFVEDLGLKINIKEGQYSGVMIVIDQENKNQMTLRLNEMLGDQSIDVTVPKEKILAIAKQAEEKRAEAEKKSIFTAKQQSEPEKAKRPPDVPRPKGIGPKK